MIHRNHRPTPQRKEGSRNVVGPEAGAVVEIADRDTNDEMAPAKMIVTAEVVLENTEVRMKGIAVGVAGIIVHERAIRSVAMILLQAPVWIMALIIHGTRGEKVDVSLRENASAEVPNITTKVVHRTTKLVKQVSKHHQRRPKLKT